MEGGGGGGKGLEIHDYNYFNSYFTCTHDTELLQCMKISLR